jgi:hypothetical protein
MRLAFIVPLAILGAWLSVANSGAGIMRSVRPDLALRFQPWDARAKAKAAEQLLIQDGGRTADLAAADRLAREALLRDPTIVAAWRSLGMVAMARRQQGDAARMFHFAGQLSRRDLPTQLWLIEERVQANDVPGALRQYDATLRSSGASYEVLFPILVQATAGDGIVEPLADLLNTMPPWRRVFIERLAAGAPDPAKLAHLMQLIRRSANADEQELMATAMRTMIERRQLEPAWRVYQLLAGASPAGTLRNGDFDHANRYPPFDWEIADGLNVGAELRPSAEGRGQHLRAFATSGSGGMVARQLLLLQPGTYEVTATAGPDDDANPAHLNWTVQCAEGTGAPLITADLPGLARRVQARAMFRVPAGCRGQWLNFNIRADFGPGTTAGWVDGVGIRRIGN